MSDHESSISPNSASVSVNAPLRPEIPDACASEAQELAKIAARMIEPTLAHLQPSDIAQHRKDTADALVADVSSTMAESGLPKTLKKFVDCVKRER